MLAVASSDCTYQLAYYVIITVTFEIRPTLEARWTYCKSLLRFQWSRYACSVKLGLCSWFSWKEFLIYKLQPLKLMCIACGLKMGDNDPWLTG